MHENGETFALNVPAEPGRGDLVVQQRVSLLRMMRQPEE